MYGEILQFLLRSPGHTFLCIDFVLHGLGLWRCFQVDQVVCATEPKEELGIDSPWLYQQQHRHMHMYPQFVADQYTMSDHKVANEQSNNSLCS